jgi:hypothetical protein
MIELTWSQMKSFIAARSVPLQCIDMDTRYWLGAFDGPLHVFAYIHKEDETANKTDFETNYQSSANKSPTPIVSPFAGKTFANKKLFARNTGFQASVTTGANTIDYTATYPWAKFIGAEVVNCEALDYIDFKVYDTAAGTYSGVPNYMLNQFGFTVNLPKDFYQRIANYDADVYQGMILRVTYNSVSEKTIGINLIMNEVK